MAEQAEAAADIENSCAEKVGKQGLIEQGGKLAIAPTQVAAHQRMIELMDDILLQQIKSTLFHQLPHFGKS